MAFNDEKLREALTQGVISEEIYNKLVEFDTNNLSQLDNENAVTSKKLKSNFETILLYVGSLVIFTGMALFMDEIIGKTNFWIILLTSIIYLVVFLFSGEFLWKNNNKKPAGIFYIFSILSLGLCITVITKMTGFYPRFSELDAYSGSGDTLNLQRPALTLISILSLAFAGFLMKFRANIFSTLPLIFGGYVLYYINVISFAKTIIKPTYLAISTICLLYSLVTVCLGVIYDKKSKIDHALWLYSLGAISIYFSVMIMLSKFDISLLWYSVIIFFFSGLFFIVALILKRKMFLFLGLFGSISSFIVIEQERLTALKAPEMLTIFVMIVTGVLVLLLGLKLKKYLTTLENFAIKLLPNFIKKHLPKTE